MPGGGGTIGLSTMRQAYLADVDQMIQDLMVIQGKAKDPEVSEPAL